MTGAERIVDEEGVRCGARRAALAALVGGTMLAGLARPAAAQVASSVDTVPLQFALNLHYLTTNFLQVVTYGEGRQLPAQHIRGGELSDKPGVSATSVLPVKFPTGVRGIQARIREIADEHWYRTLMLRAVLRADAPAQTEIDYSAQTFARLFVAAGAMASTDTLYLYTASPSDPLELVRNILLAAETLVSVQASVFAALLPSMTNEVTLPMMASLAASAASNATTIRSMLYEMAQAKPDLLTKVDRLAAWRDRIDGTATTDAGLSPVNGSGRTAVTDADGLYIGRTPQQALNVLFMSADAVTQGGFFPTGINGAIVRSGKAN